MYRLLIVDDERYLVESIYELISAQSELDLDILTCCYSDEAMQIINSQRIDLILLDINMPGKTGLEIADELAEIWPSCQIIFLTGYADFDYIYRSSKLKNATFLLKTEDRIRCILDTGRSIPIWKSAGKYLPDMIRQEKK